MKKFIALTVLLIMACDSLLGQDSSVESGQTELSQPAATQYGQYDRYFNEINEVRIGIPDNLIASLSNPFVAVVVPSNAAAGGNATAITFRLNAILENRVKINDNWLSRGSLINGMRVAAIKQNSVVLSNENRVIELFLREKNENSIITTN